MAIARQTDWGVILQVLASWGFFAGNADGEIDPSMRAVMRAIDHATWFAKRGKRMEIKKNGMGGIVFVEWSERQEYKCRADGSSCVVQRDGRGDVVRSTELEPALPLPAPRT